ncbi:putative toll-like receptor 13 [Triplophysa rosa]|uniref:Toll-like receptor 13 n=1 Tax=Triplophysa rosa TaxID=992332 RepID=A0A9W7TWS0_TRIRA|nr:putative toll-like receptor 13 [Triplophysa rosa]
MDSYVNEKLSEWQLDNLIDTFKEHKRRYPASMYKRGGKVFRPTTDEAQWSFIDMQPVHAETLDVIMKEMRVGLLNGDVPTAFAMLMGTIYCLNLQYPHNMRYSFEFLQKVVMKSQPDHCSAQIHVLRNKLLGYPL